MPEHDPQVGHARSLDSLHVGFGDARVRRGDHRIDQVERDGLTRQLRLAGFHRTTRHEHGGDVESQGGHQHARRDLVAVGDTHQRIGHVCVRHELHAVRDELARGQAVQHAVVAHRDAVVHGDGVELLADAACFLDLGDDELPEVLQVYVPGDELGEGVGDGDDRLAEVAIFSYRWRARGRGRLPCCGRRCWFGSGERAWSSILSAGGVSEHGF